MIKIIEEIINNKILSASPSLDEEIGCFRSIAANHLGKIRADHRGLFVTAVETMFIAQKEIAQLQEQVKALAAEGATMLRLLTDISEQYQEVQTESDENAAVIDLDYISEVNTYVSRDVNAENPFPANDAIVAEMKAQGADRVAQYHKERFEFLANTRRDISAEHKAAYLCALDVAAQLRKQGGE